MLTRPAASDSILTDTDNGVGCGIENAEDNTAANIDAAKASVPGARSVAVRQLDKIASTITLSYPKMRRY